MFAVSKVWLHAFNLRPSSSTSLALRSQWSLRSVMQTRAWHKAASGCKRAEESFLSPIMLIVVAEYTFQMEALSFISSGHQSQTRWRAGHVSLHTAFTRALGLFTLDACHTHSGNFDLDDETTARYLFSANTKNGTSNHATNLSNSELAGKSIRTWKVANHSLSQPLDHV